MPTSKIELLRVNVTPFKSISEDHATISRYFDSFGDCKVLVISDASHDTSEFYYARAEITKFMIENHGFNIVAVEADWLDAEHVDRYARRRPGPGQGTAETIQMTKKEGREPAFLRFPTGYGAIYAEHYYRAIYHARNESWNLRDTHMSQALVRVLKHRGSSSKAIGDVQVVRVRPGLPNSYEELMHATGVKKFVLDLRKSCCNERLRKALAEPRLERFIGVLYKPSTEKQSHYSTAVLPEQFDGFIWFDESRHVGALEVHQPTSPSEYHETWPFGL
ncbi:hypothetical protein FZEAL_3199 [Fusarium zealandicum]|uniref:Uncharacterized protein n=1 Tax=Fusarium zealandicum TaxID=1053134 RepID=A0A8H4XM27_9HYPO|nr:hypothetical protein FZEAL_3199 [Fusarium zealandicum]